MDNFDSLFPTFKGAVQDLHNGLLVFAYLIMVLGLLLAAYRGMFGSLAEMVQAMISVAILCVVLNHVDDWTFEVGNLVNDHVMDTLGSDPRATHTRFGELIANPEEEDDQAWYEKIFDVETAVAKALGYFFIWLAAKIAWLIVWWAYFIQKGLLYFSLSLAPIFLPMLLLNATRGISIRYILGLISLLLWPLGWAVANLMTDALLKAGADKVLFEFGPAGEAAYGPQMIFFLLLAALWLVFSTIAAPVILGKIVSSGAQIGTALLGGFMGSMGSGLSGALGGAAMGGSSASMAAGAAAGGGMGFLGASMGSPSLATGAGMAALASASGGSGSGQSQSSGGGSSGTDYNSKAAAIAAKHSS